MDKLLDKIIENMKKNDCLTDDEEIVRFGLEIMIEKAIFIVIIAAFQLLKSEIMKQYAPLMTVIIPLSQEK